MSNNGTSANKDWIVCGLLLLATMINYMDRLTLNQTISRIMVDFDFQKDFYGKIEGVFGLAFAVGAITTGLIVDKVSVKFLYPLMVFFWSLSVYRQRSCGIDDEVKRACQRGGRSSDACLVL